MSEHIHYVTDGNFERSAAVPDARPGGLLGGMVRPVQDDRPDSRRRRSRIQRQAQSGQAEHRREPGNPAKFGIRGIPTLMLFKGGNVEATKVGALSKSQLTAFIDSNL